MLVYPREVLQNRRHHHDGGVMQDKSAAGDGFPLRVAASFNKSINYAPSAPDAAKLRRCLRRYSSKARSKN